MIRSAAILEIKRGLGYRTTQDTTIIAALQEAQRTLELGHTLPNWLITYDSAITVTANSATFTLPARFIRFHDDYSLYYTNSNAARVFIPRRNYTEAYQAYVASGEADASDVSTDTSGGYPSVVVARNKTTAILIPTPTVGFTAYLSFYQGALVLDGDIENAWLLNAPDVLIGMAGMRCAGIVRDKGAMDQFAQRANMGGKSLMGDIVEDEIAGRGLIMGRNN